MASTSFLELTGMTFIRRVTSIYTEVSIIQCLCYAIGVFSIEVLAVFKRRVVMKKKKKSGIKKVGIKKVRAK